MMGGTAMRPAATVMTRSASRTGTGLVGRGFIPQLERAAGSRTITVIGSGDDVARYANKPGFNVFPPEAGLSKQELDRANAFWLNQAIRRGDTIWQVTNPQRWAKFMARKGKRSAYLDLELLMLEQYTGVKPVPAWVP